MKILIVEDDQRIADFISRGLKAEGFFVSVINDGQLAVEAALSIQPDIMVLDRMLPNQDGIQICKLIRAQRLPIRILMLSALGEVGQRIEGLRAGADDYLPKPFDFEELLVRIEVLAKRSHFEVRPTQLVVGDLSLDLSTLQVKRGEITITLTAKELGILELLMSSPGKVFSRERILTNVWGINEDPLTNVVDVYMRRLRKKIDEGFERKYLKTLRGVGYALADNDD